MNLGEKMISKDIEVNKEKLYEIFNNTSDFKTHEFFSLAGYKLLLVYYDNTIDKQLLNQNLINPLIKDIIYKEDIDTSVYLGESKKIKRLEDSLLPLNQGNVLLIVEDLEEGYLFNLSKWITRAVEKPVNEPAVRGPQESFVEDIAVNKSMIRRRIKNSRLIFEDIILGEITNTTISIAYIEGLPKKEILKELKTKLKDIKVDGILDSGYIESYLDPSYTRILSTLSYTERPDVLVGKILEGRIGVLCNGSPNVLALPKLFIENLHTGEDYYMRPQYASFLRILRFFAYIISFTFTPIYVALILFHQEMVPTDLLISIASQREGVPFASALEALLMIVFFDLLKESAVRLPSPVGQAITLVGGLVIGQAVAEAGIVSASLIIAVAASGMSEFVVPKLRETITIYRYGFLFLASILGLYGVSLGFVMVIVHMVSIKSFGVPYMWPMAPWDTQGMKDNILKFPVKYLNYRPNVFTDKSFDKRDDVID